MTAMDMRQYDPAIGRWIVQDPITHHSQSPYCAFDNNPVFWQDPTGADGQLPDFMQKLWDATPDDGKVHTYTFTNATDSKDRDTDSETIVTEADVQNPFEYLNEGPGKPGRWDLLSAKSFNFKNIAKKYRAARITNLYFSIYDVATETTYESTFSLEIGVPTINSKTQKAYGAKYTAEKCTLVLNSVASQYMMVQEILSNLLLHKLTVNDSTLPYIFATVAQFQLNKYFPGSSVTANTFRYKTVNEKSAVWVNYFKYVLDKNGLF